MKDTTEATFSAGSKVLVEATMDVPPDENGIAQVIVLLDDDCQTLSIDATQLRLDAAEAGDARPDLKEHYRYPVDGENVRKEAMCFDCRCSDGTTCERHWLLQIADALDAYAQNLDRLVRGNEDAEREIERLTAIEKRAKGAAREWSECAGDCPPEIAHGIGIAKYILEGKKS